tara:strand:- start:3 stop:896 length:894 start_codon:yes stop_codon:yes gene_type:complete
MTNTNWWNSFPFICTQILISLTYALREKKTTDSPRSLRSSRGGSTSRERKNSSAAASPAIPSSPLAVANTEKKKEKEKEKEKEKAKQQESPRTMKARYKGLGAELKNEAGNPIRYDLLHESTREEIEAVGIEVDEKDPVKWSCLLNCLRFLKIDIGIHFSQKVTPPREFDELEVADILDGPAPPKLKLMKEIGSGAYGRVFEGKLPSLDTKKHLAVKKMSHKEKKEIVQNLNEIFYLSKYGHPNICHYFKAFTCKDEIWMVTELMQGGTLSEAHRYVQEEEEEVEEDRVRRESILTS